MENFDVVYKKYWKYVCAIIRNRLKNITPEDIAQKVFCALMAQEKSPDDVKNWLISVTIHECINYTRKMSTVKKYIQYAIYTGETTTIQEDNDKHLQQEQQELIKRIQIEINKLPPKSRRAFVLHYLHGYKCREVAKIMGVNESTIFNQIKRARDILKNKIAAPFKAQRN